MSGETDAVERALNSVERLMRMFMVERAIYLLGATASLALLAYATFLLVSSGDATREQLALLFGSGGLFAVSGVQVTFFLNRAFKILEQVQGIAAPGPGAGPVIAAPRSGAGE